MEAKQKILICGDARGHFRTLFNRLETINKKNGPFELMLCVGDFFGPNAEQNDELQAYRSGNKIVAVPTYILGSNSAPTDAYYADLPESGELCPNLTYLGARGLYTVASGIKIAYVSGVEGGGGVPHQFDEAAVRAVQKSCLTSRTAPTDYRGVDILITSQWPAGVDDSAPAQVGSKMLSWLAQEIRPRYHFCGMADVYFERVPYRNSTNTTTSIETATRFISLAAVPNAAKAKYLYALNICSVDKMRILDIIQKTTNETPSPYIGMKLLKLHPGPFVEPAPQFFFDVMMHGKRKVGPGQSKKDNKKPVFDQEKCWFCLSSSSVEKHLVITVGEHFYLALAKGPVNETHCLLLPVTHVQNAALLSEDSWKELDRFKDALIDMFKAANQVTSFFERNYRSSHLQINVVAVDKSREANIKNAFDKAAQKYDLTLEELPPLLETSDLPNHGPYFVTELPNRKVLLTRPKKMFPLHFGREPFCAAGVLDCPQKVEWKECELTYSEEVELVQKLRIQFKDFNFTA